MMKRYLTARWLFLIKKQTDPIHLRKNSQIEIEKMTDDFQQIVMHEIR